MTFFSAFMLVGFAGLIITPPFMKPIELQIISFKLNPIATSLSYVLMFVAVGFVYWVYRSLASESVMLARKETGLSYGAPKLAFALGGYSLLAYLLQCIFLTMAQVQLLQNPKSNSVMHINTM